MNLTPYLLTLITILLIACNKPTVDSTDKINSPLALTVSKNAKSIITGKCLDESTRTAYYLHSKYGNDQILIDSNQFKVSLEHDSPMIVDLSIKYNVKYPIFISPGDSIHLEYNEVDLLNNFKLISFSGSHTEENELLLKLKDILKYDNTNYSSFFNCSEEVFLHKIDSVQHIAHEILQVYQKKKSTDHQDFKILTQSYIDFKIASYLENYPQKMKNTFRQGTITLSEAYLQKKNSYPLNNSSHLNNISFANYVTRVLSINAKNIFYDENNDKKGRSITDLNTFFKSIDAIFENKEIIDYLKFIVLEDEIFLTREKPEPFFKQYEASNPPSAYLLKLENKLSKINFTKKDYVFKDSDGNDRYLSEFKNKIVYIDIWATWCAPCMYETKYFEELINRFGDKNKDIVFIGLSIDTDIRKWSKMLQIKEMKGIQLISPLGFKAEICQDFAISGIPRFMIIDRQGVIIEPNALRPSNEETYTYLKKLTQTSPFF